MKLTTQIKPISHFKANAAEIIKNMANTRQPMVITQNGEAQAVVVDVATYVETQETLALLKILALGNKQIEEGKVSALDDVIKKLKTKSSSS